MSKYDEISKELSSMSIEQLRKAISELKALLNDAEPNMSRFKTLDTDKYQRFLTEYQNITRIYTLSETILFERTNKV